MGQVKIKLMGKMIEPRFINPSLKKSKLSPTKRPSRNVDINPVSQPQKSEGNALRRQID